LHPNDEANFMIASTSSHLQDEINAVTWCTSTKNMKLNEKKTNGIYRFLFEESTTITASDCQQPTPRESTKSNCLAYIQGCRKHQKVGGASVSRGTIRMKRTSKKFFPRMLPTGGGGGCRLVASMYSWRGVGQKF
jgi:hypothetical protein